MRIKNKIKQNVSNHIGYQDERKTKASIVNIDKLKNKMYADINIKAYKTESILPPNKDEKNDRLCSMPNTNKLIRFPMPRVL